MQKFVQDQDCCEVWPKIVSRFDWMEYEQQQDMLSMPHIDDGQTKWFVNFCPACGRPARNRNVAANRVHNNW